MNDVNLVFIGKDHNTIKFPSNKALSPVTLFDFIDEQVMWADGYISVDKYTFWKYLFVFSACFYKETYTDDKNACIYGYNIEIK